jgi:hypothetical protein
MKLHPTEGPAPVRPPPDDAHVDGLLTSLPRSGCAPRLHEPLLAAYASGRLGPNIRLWIEGLLVHSAASRARLYRLRGVRHAR